jgi:hypothetical protein
MDVGWFLHQRVAFIRQLYAISSAPFVERQCLIVAGEAPFEPPYSEDGESPFLAEWLEADDSVHVLGHACVSMLAAALQVYFKTWQRQARLPIDEAMTKFFKKRGWFTGYQKLFGDQLGVRFNDSPVDLALLEEVVLVRNRVQHPDSLTRVRPNHAEADLERLASPFFLDDRERDLLLEADEGVRTWLMPPTLHVTTDKLRAALDSVDRFGTWFNAAIIAKLYPL